MSHNLDFERQERQGFPEVVYGEGKTDAQLRDICRAFEKESHPLLITRIDKSRSERLSALFPDGHAKRFGLARCFRWTPEGWTPPGVRGKVALLCAGSSDFPVLEEARVVLDFFGIENESHTDIGVAGLHRLLNKSEAIKRADVVIVVAGMEGALPSVVGGLVAAPVIAVPTSVGYGASLGGISALLGMLNSCAAGVTVTNIDNGFGAAMAAFRILRNSLLS